MSNPMPSPSFINEEECNKVIQELFKSGDISSDGYDHYYSFSLFLGLRQPETFLSPNQIIL